MMTEIKDFFGNGKGKSRIERFEALSDGKSQEEKRGLELQLLKPDKIPPHIHEKADKSKFSPITTRSVRMVFPDDESLELFKKHFSVSRHVEASLTDMDKLLAIIRLLDSGEVTYDKKSNKATVVKK